MAYIDVLLRNFSLAHYVILRIRNFQQYNTDLLLLVLITVGSWCEAWHAGRCSRLDCILLLKIFTHSCIDYM